MRQLHLVLNQKTSLHVMIQNSRKEHGKELVYLAKDLDMARSNCADTWHDLVAVASVTLMIERPRAAALHGSSLQTYSQNSSHSSLPRLQHSHRHSGISGDSERCIHSIPGPHASRRIVHTKSLHTMKAPFACHTSLEAKFLHLSRSSPDEPRAPALPATRLDNVHP